MNEKKCFFNSEIQCQLNHNIIKTRDDACPVCIIKDKDGKYLLCKHHLGCSWAKSNHAFEENILKERIEPWLTSLFQSEHLSLLAGSGLTTGICQIANKSAAGMPSISFSIFHDEIQAEVERTAVALGRQEGNFEDYIRVANELLVGLQIIKHPDTIYLIPQDS